MGLGEDVGSSFAATGQRLGVKDATLIKVTPGTRTVDAMSAGTNPTTVSHACKGLVATFATQRIDGTIIRAEDRTVSLYAVSLPGGVVPKLGDKITIEGATFRIVGDVSRNPAGGVYKCHGRV